LPKLVMWSLLRPARRLKRPVQLVCHEDKQDRLMVQLAAHAYDVALSDSPIGTAVSVRAFNHELGACPVGFFGVPDLAAQYETDFPESLNDAPMVLPTPNTALRRSLDRWFDQNGVRPRLVAECEDSALLKVFGQRGEGLFPAPSVVTYDIVRQYQVKTIGEIDAVRARFYAITVERRIKNPVVMAICEGAREMLRGLA
jgi:LysR family transcriptional activator of nhaA